MTAKLTYQQLCALDAKVAAQTGGIEKQHDDYCNYIAAMPQAMGMLKRYREGLEKIAFSDASEWPNCSSRELAKQLLQEGEG